MGYNFGCVIASGTIFDYRDRSSESCYPMKAQPILRFKGTLPWQTFSWLSIYAVHIGATRWIQINRPCALCGGNATLCQITSTTCYYWNSTTKTVQVTPLGTILSSSPYSECASFHQQGYVGSKTAQQNPPVLKWWCEQMQVDLYNDHEMVGVIITGRCACRANCQYCIISPPQHHHNRFTALFPGPPGWAGARRELLDFMVQGKFNCIISQVSISDSTCCTNQGEVK